METAVPWGRRFCLVMPGKLLVPCSGSRRLLSDHGRRWIMNKLSILLVSSLFASIPALAAPDPWDPDPAIVHKVDEEVAKLPNFKRFTCPPPDIKEFGRYYGGFTDINGHRMIIGQLRSLKSFPGSERGIHIVRKPMAVVDGGCSVANVWFDADPLKRVQAFWGGR